MNSEFLFLLLVIKSIEKFRKKKKKKKKIFIKENHDQNQIKKIKKNKPFHFPFFTNKIQQIPTRYTKKIMKITKLQNFKKPPEKYFIDHC
jgi:hypothetical protein